MRQIFFLFILISTLKLSAQHSELEKLRRLYYEEGTSDSMRCVYLGEMGYFHAFRDYDSSRYYLKRALDYSQSIGNPTLRNRYFNFLGMAHAVNGKLDSSINAFENAFEVAQNANLDSAKAQSLYGLGNVYHSLGDMPKALEYFLKALSFFETIKDYKSASSTKANIAEIYLSLEEFEKAKRLVFESNAYYMQHNIQTGIRNGYKRLAKIFRAEGSLDSAFHYLSLARDLAISHHNETFAIATIEISMGDVLFDNAKFSKAIEYYKSGLNNYESIKGEPEEILEALSRLAYCYATNGDRVNGSKYLNRAKELAVNSESLEYKIGFYEVNYKIDSIFGHPTDALKSFQKLTSLKDQLLDQTKSQQLTEMETKYETEKKEAEIVTLSQQAAIQELKIAQRNQTIVIGLVGFALILIIAYFIYREHTIKKDRIQTELEHRFLRSQLNPHFIFNALLAIQNFMLKNDGQTAAMYLTKFSKLMRQILESSRVEFIPVEEEVEMLKNYMDIHQLRLQNSFSYSIDIADNIDPETDTIPPMFVQPFVENAIEHGIVNAKEKGLIELTLKKVAGYITIEIKDNGSGLSGGSSNPKEHNSLATTIIKERMELFNKTLKDQIQLVLGDIRGENGEVLGTKVELKVPFGYI